MHYRFIRDSFWGRFAYHISGHRIFTHAEDSPDYVIPKKYLEEFAATQLDKEDAEKEEFDSDSSASSTVSDKTLVRDSNIYVDWDGPEDPENPQNWPFVQKAFFIFEIAFLTTSVYMASAIFTPGITQIMAEFNVNETKATLPLTMFVIGYGLGPMVLSPMSENAALGRTSIYISTLFLFFILQIPTALSKNIAALTVLRFLSGVFASPALATGGASVGDVLGLPYAPIGIATWCIGAVCGPSLGPLVGSVLAVKGGWRWTFWFMAIISGSTFLVLGFLLPETYGKTLLLRKAKRLRVLTGNDKITTPEEIENRNIEFSALARQTLWRPIEISTTEPVVLLINLYIALVYSILYLWFEAFPLVFLGVYKFTLIEMGVSYVSIMLGIMIGAFIYLYWVRKAFTLKVLAGGEVTPEVFIPGAFVGGALMPIGLFIFGWTAAEDIHWIAPLIGAALFSAGCFVVFQTLFNYLGMSFYRFAASVFASNTLFRSVIASVFPLFGRALFYNLRTSRFVAGWGSSVLGFITLAMLLIPTYFYINGPKLRAKSKFAN